MSALATGLGLGVAPVATAAPPDNDNRANATGITPPQTVTGTLVDATREPSDPPDYCASSDASVWYRFTAPKRGAVIVQLDAAGDMDASVNVFKRIRSKVEFVDCDDSDAKGIATVDTEELNPGDEYLISVGRQVGSVSDTFELRVLIPSPPPELPGRNLPSGGVRNQVDRLTNPGDLFRTRMQAGRTMRLSLAASQCTSLAVFGPDTNSLSATPVKRLRCGGYRLFTPTASGSHYLLVEAGKARGKQSYRLQVAPARRDDTTPGIFIRNNARARGKLNGRLDSVDLYRFDVTRLSTLNLEVSGGPTMELVRDNGNYVDSGDFIDRRVRAGRYFVAVEGAGKYTLRRVSRTITTATLRFNNRRSAVIGSNATANLNLRVKPNASGRGLIRVERFDPIAGWQFLRTYSVNVSNGSASVAFRPPSVGRYRAFAEYRGSSVAAPDDSGVARLRVQDPLQD